MDKKTILLVAAVIAIIVLGGGAFWFLTRSPQTSEPLPEAPSKTETPADTAVADAAVEAVLQALNDGDYESFSQQASEEVKSQVTAEIFTQMRDAILKTSGRYLSKSEPQISEPQAGLKAFTYPCRFEREEVMVTVAFKTGEEKIAGLNLDSEGLRQLQQ